MLSCCSLIIDVRPSNVCVAIERREIVSSFLSDIERCSSAMVECDDYHRNTHMMAYTHPCAHTLHRYRLCYWKLAYAVDKLAAEKCRAKPVREQKDAMVFFSPISYQVGTGYLIRMQQKSSHHILCRYRYSDFELAPGLRDLRDDEV
jgi:hypothetical protein